jgi:uncharacterized protein YecT (DUF1311 family)
MIPARLVVLFAVCCASCLPAFADSQPSLAAARTEFQAADAVLNKTYKTVCAGLTKSQVATLRELQRDWVQYRDQHAQDLLHFNGDDPANEDTPEKSAAYWKYMTDITTTRIKFLKVYTGANVPRGISGAYSDFYDGYLTLKETKQGIEFSCDVVRGRAADQGDISGVAHLKGDKAYYKEVIPPDQDDKDRKPAQLTFTFIDGHIVKVESKDTDYYQGMSANFDSTYYKTKE